MKRLELAEVTGVIIHCAATKPKMDIGAKEIKDWHLKRGWSDIGYHWVIRRDGKIETGRSSNLIGAHCKGQNSHNIGICLVGGIDEKGKPENNFTDEQWFSLIGFLKGLPLTYPNIENITGHNEHSNKACPSFDVQEWKKEFNIYFKNPIQDEKKS